MCKYLLIFVVLSAIACDIVLGEYIPPGPKYNCPKNPNQIFPCKCEQGTDEGLYITCNDSNLAALSVSIQTLASLDTKVESLSISNCLIEQLHGPLFHKSSIRVINIRDTPISEISEEFFLGVNETLQELRIINSRLKQFPKEAVRVLGSLVILSLDGHNITDLPKDVFAESLLPNNIEKIYISNGEVSNIESETFQACRKLKVLDVHGNNLTALKKNQFKNLRNLEVLDLSFNHLKKFDASNIFDLTKLGWCNLTHNSLTEIARGSFARSSLVKWIDFSHNQLKKVDANALRGMRFLRRLYLNDNQISDVGRGAFTAVSRIGTINLARNELKKVDYQMFYQLNYAEEINVAENNITIIEKEAFKDLYLAKINISHNSLSTIEQNAFLNCVNMTVLDLSHNNLTAVQKKAFDEITYAYDLQVSFNSFVDLSQVPLQNMSGLRVLNVSHNNLEMIPKNTFPKLYELHTVDVSYNKLTFIAASVFQNLFSLRTIDMSFNSLDSLNLTTFGPLTTVLELRLNNNLLTTVHRNCFTKMSSLQSLWMENNLLDQMMFIPISLNRLFFANNSVKSFQERQWPVMNSLLYLDMSDNQLGDSLELSSFTGLLTLQELFLRRNNISTYPKDALNTLATLRFLHMEGNNISKLEKSSLGRMNTLYQLNFFENQIDAVGAKVFEGLPQLVILNLSRNAISNLSMDTFVNLVSLQTLDLSGNFIEKLDNKSASLLDPLYSLREVDLSHNKFSTLTRFSFPSNIYVPYNLQKIDLSYNLMSYIPADLKYGTGKLKVLNLSHNQISGLNFHVLSNLTQLDVLDMSHNDLHDERGFLAFRVPENLTELNLSDNNLNYMPVKNMSATLKRLNLENNNFEDIEGDIRNFTLNWGLEVNFQNNPIRCGCSLRPFKHFAEQFSAPPEYLKTILCDAPESVAGQLLVDADETLLICDDDSLAADDGDPESVAKKKELGINPDIKFRKVFVNNGVLSAFWYVTGKRDIADFYVVIRHISTGEIVYETTIGYNRRSVNVPAGRVTGAARNSLQLCIIAKRSNHELGYWSEEQCARLTSELLRDGGNRNFYQSSVNSSAMRWLSAAVTKELLLMHFFGLALWRWVSMG